MKYGFKFSNLLGAVYKGGNIIFTPDGTSILSPVGNKITVFDLANHTSVTLPFENQHNIQRLALSPNGQLLLSIDIEGRALLVNYRRRVVLSHFNFKQKPKSVKFSPNGKYFAMDFGRTVKVFKPPHEMQKEFLPITLARTYRLHTDDITCMDWSHDSKFILTGSRDGTMRIAAIKQAGFMPFTLSGFDRGLIGCFFSEDSKRVYGVDQGGMSRSFKWRPLQEGEETQKGITKATGKWVNATGYNVRMPKTKITCAAFSKAKNLLVTAYEDGLFNLYDMPEGKLLQTMSISQRKISTVDINVDGAWVAFGSKEFGQLLVWEWQTESYVLKQQGHQLSAKSVSYSPDGQLVATVGDDMKVKVWNTTTGFCFVTFSDHTAPVNDVQFSPKLGAQVVVSASSDGTVRAYDLIRYRNFRTFVSPTPTQFATVAVDPSGDLVCAGSLDSFQIYVWSMQTGRLLDVLGGHKGPISSITFSPASPVLASVSWDKTLILWEVYESQQKREPLTHVSDVVALAYRPDGMQVATATLNGAITLWDPESGDEMGSIDGRWDIMGGRLQSDARSAKNTEQGKHFSSIIYTPDGSCLLGAGDSKYICMYDVRTMLLVRKFQTSRNISLDGVLDFLNSKEMTEAGSLSQLEPDYDSDEEHKTTSLPGVQGGKFAQKHLKQPIRTLALGMSPTGRAWAASTTEGLLIYSLDETLIFDPFDLDLDCTPENILKTLTHREYLKALVMSFRLNEKEIILQVMEGIPHNEVQLCAQGFPIAYLPKMLDFLANNLETTVHIEHQQLWLLHILTLHSAYMEEHSLNLLGQFRALLKAVTKWHTDLARLCDDNLYSLTFLSDVPRTFDTKIEDGEDAEMIEDDDDDEEVGDVDFDENTDYSDVLIKMDGDAVLEEKMAHVMAADDDEANTSYGDDMLMSNWGEDDDDNTAQGAWVDDDEEKAEPMEEEKPKPTKTEKTPKKAKKSTEEKTPSKTTTEAKTPNKTTTEKTPSKKTPKKSAKK